MTTQNTYASLAEFKAYITSRGQTATTDTTDDAVIESLLKQASRYIDSKTAEKFYPSYATYYLDVPDALSDDPRLLKLGRAFLSIVSVTNGDGNSITSTDYDLHPRNAEPITGIRLKDSVTTAWTTDGSGSRHAIITVVGWVGYHDRYTNDGYTVGSTLNEDLDTSELAFTMTSGTAFSIGQIIKIESELCYISGVSSNDVTVAARGANGTTAATHVTGTSVYIWQPMDEARNATLEIANTAYQRRFGRNLGATETVTAGGLVIAPRDVPQMAAEFINTYKRRL